MSTDETIERTERILTSHQRKTPITLPVEPTDEELAQEWTLSEDDKVQVFRCRGDTNRRRFAIQLCVLRKYGRFLDDYSVVPLRILNYISRQLSLHPVLFVEKPDYGATETDQEKRIRDYLGYQPFNQNALKKLKDWLYVSTTEEILPAKLFHHAEEVLRSWKIVSPAPSTLERIVASVVAQARIGIFDQISKRLPEEVRSAIDHLLEVPPGERKSKLFYLKEYPPAAKASSILTYIKRYHFISSIGTNKIDLGGISPEQIQHLSQQTRRYDVEDLKRFAPAKRYSLVICFLVEIQKTILDYIIVMNDRHLANIYRSARNSFEGHYYELRQHAKKGLETLVKAMKIILDSKQPQEKVLTDLYQQIDRNSLDQALSNCQEFRRLEDSGFIDELRLRYYSLRKYIPAFFKFPFEGEPGTGSILQGLSLVRKLYSSELKELPSNAPIEFVPNAWRNVLTRKDGSFDRRVWEFSLCLAIRDALRSGDLYLPGSRHHISFWKLAYNEQQWKEKRKQAYIELSLPNEADLILQRLRQELNNIAWQVENGINQNPFATVYNGRLKLKRNDALELPDRVQELRRVIETNLPRIRIEDLLSEVDSWCEFTKEFRPLGGYRPRGENLYIALLAALIAHGTNLGIAAMGHSVEEVTVDMLQHVSKWFLREETLRRANATLVNYHYKLSTSSVWGDGTKSSSDGQRFGIQASSLLASFYPRYFGYYDRAITVYTHISDQYSVFATRAISCTPREALYVLDGLLENNTILRPREHYTDTHGYTEHLFGLCYLLGYSFMPRIKDLADQQLYKIDGGVTYGELASLLNRRVHTDLIREQWDQLVRVIASLRNRTAPAHIIVKRLVSSSPSDRLAKALTAFGRIIKTIYILRYIQDEETRHKVQLQLNRGEYRHGLARCTFFANQGEFRTGDYEEIMNKVSCLGLLLNAVLVWNTVQIGKIVEQLVARGEPVDNEDLARVSPLLYSHVIPTGTYLFNRGKQGAQLCA